MIISQIECFVEVFHKILSIYYCQVLFIYSYKLMLFVFDNNVNFCRYYYYIFFIFFNTILSIRIKKGLNCGKMLKKFCLVNWRKNTRMSVLFILCFGIYARYAKKNIYFIGVRWAFGLCIVFVFAMSGYCSRRI